MSRPHHKQEAGFTLVELLLAMAISGVMLGAMLAFFLGQQQYLGAQEQVTEMLQNARVAMDMIVEDVRLTGYGAPKCLAPPACLTGYRIPNVQLVNWIPTTWVTPALTLNPQITQGVGTAPDSISIVGGVDAPDQALATATGAGPGGTIPKGTFTLILPPGKGSEFNTNSKRLIFIGNENAMITAIAGDVLTIDTDPVTIGNQGLTGAYPANTAVVLVKVITYQIVDNTLKRNENTGGESQPVAENIEDLQIPPRNDNSITISLTARTSKPDPRYRNPTKGDHYRRRTLSAEIQLRNLGL